MISSIYAEKVKGLTFRQALSKHTLLLGPVGSGKSARGQAIMLAVLGFVPGGPKKNDEILSTYGDGQSMKAVITVDGDELGRAFVNNGTSVSQSFGICGKKGKEADFSKALGSHGDPRIVDVGAFMALSSQKQVDSLFALYPPEEDLNKLQAEIDTEAARLASIVERKRGIEGTVARLIASKTDLPAGTLAETNDAIQKLEAELELATKDLAVAEERDRAEKAEAERKEKERLFHEEQSRIREEEDRAKVVVPVPEEHPIISSPSLDKGIGYPVKGRTEERGFMTVATPIGISPGVVDIKAENGVITAVLKSVPPVDGIPPISWHDGADRSGLSPLSNAIQSIISAMVGAGCEACAAMMVAKRELKKFREVK